MYKRLIPHLENFQEMPEAMNSVHFPFRINGMPPVVVRTNERTHLVIIREYSSDGVFTGVNLSNETIRFILEDIDKGVREQVRKYYNA